MSAVCGDVHAWGYSLSQDFAFGVIRICSSCGSRQNGHVDPDWRNYDNNREAILRFLNYLRVACDVRLPAEDALLIDAYVAARTLRGEGW